MQSGHAVLLLWLCSTGAHAAEAVGPDVLSEEVTIHAPLWRGAFLAHSTCAKRYPAFRNDLDAGLEAYRIELIKADAGVRKDVDERGANGPRELDLYNVALEQRTERLDSMLSTLNEETCGAMSRLWKSGNADMLIQFWKTIVGKSPTSTAEVPAQEGDRRP
jgi:hypothetical protein